MVDIDGLQSFEEIRNKDVFYVDKTGFMKEWWKNGDSVTLITRPRRFGKTLNLSMVECFFSNRYAERADLFEGLSIWEEEECRKWQGTYPVIFLSFAKVKTSDYKGMRYAIANIIFEAYQRNRFLLDNDTLSENEKEYFNGIKPNMGEEVQADAINRLSDFLSRYYEKKVIILLDEYDTPMQETWLSGYWDEAVSFFRGFFNATFKTKPYMERGLITGITRVSKESIFSDLNNLKVITTTSEKYAAYFGFTEQEVFQALDNMGLSEEKQGVKDWYDGFTFGSVRDIYNPWSITNFISRKGEYDTYWADSSGNGLINSLIRRGSADIKKKTELLMQGGSFEVELDEQIVFDQLDHDENAIWSLLLATGYLRVEHLERKGRLLHKYYTLKLTNLEIESMFARMIRGWFGGRNRQDYNDFIKALLIDDVDAMNEFMNRIALQSFSSFDIAKGAAADDNPERLASCCDRKGAANGSSLYSSTNLQDEADASSYYHGFVLGLMVGLEERFAVSSNKESGFGRYDVLLKPVDKEKDNAYIFEFKVHKPGKEKNLEATVANALGQIKEKGYETELIAEGILPEHIRKYGFAFAGKKCLIG